MKSQRYVEMSKSIRNIDLKQGHWGTNHLLYCIYSSKGKSDEILHFICLLLQSNKVNQLNHDFQKILEVRQRRKMSQISEHKQQPAPEIVVGTYSTSIIAIDLSKTFIKVWLLFPQSDIVDEDDFLKAVVDNKLPMVESYLARRADPNTCDSVGAETNPAFHSDCSAFRTPAEMIITLCLFFCSSSAQFFTERALRGMWRLWGDCWKLGL